MEADEKIGITISDDGIGFNAESAENSGFGLKNIQARAAEINARLEFSSTPGQGVNYKIIV